MRSSGPCYHSKCVHFLLRNCVPAPMDRSYTSHLLAACVFLSGWIPLAGAVTAALGMPLSGPEYEIFFAALKPTQRAVLMCLERLASGCAVKEIVTLDKLENHGLVPTEHVCTDVAGFPEFSDFCQFATHRCATRNYYAKRILCRQDVAAVTQEQRRAGESPGTRRRPGVGRRSLGSEYDDPLPVWRLPPDPGEAPPAPEYEDLPGSDLDDLFARLKDPTAARAAERLREAVSRGDASAADRASALVIEALKDAGWD